MRKLAVAWLAVVFGLVFWSGPAATSAHAGFGAYSAAADSADVRLGTGDFTISFWVKADVAQRAVQEAWNAAPYIRPRRPRTGE